jgi:GAF domain-containing protein
LEKAHTLCGADAGSFVLNTGGERLPAVAIRGYADEHALNARHGLLITEPGIERLARGETIHIPDISRSPHSAMPLLRSADQIARAIAKTTIELTGNRTYLAVPLRKDGRLLGYLSAQRKQVRPFSDREVALLQNFAAQAVIAIENARLLGELRDRTHQLEQSLEYQTATGDVLKAISGSAFDLQPVLDTLVETAARLCNAQIAGLVRGEGDDYRLAATFSLSSEYIRFFGDRGWRADRGTIFGRTVLERQVVHISDVAADPEYAVPETFTIGKFRTILGVPLLRGAEPIGALCLGRQWVEPFTDRQVEVVRNFADQAVIAIENARLLTETREALEQQTAAAEVLQVINSSPGDLSPVFDALLEKATGLCEAAFGVLCTYDGKCFHPSAIRGDPQFAEWLRARSPFLPRPGSPFEQIVQGDLFVRIGDTETNGIYHSSSGFRELVDAAGIRSHLVVALRKEELLTGAVAIYRKEVSPFSDKQVALLENFAAQAVIAMENARLITETREALEQQTATAALLQVINSSPGDLGPVFDAILEKAHSLCGADHGSLTVRDGDRLRAAATYAYSEAWAERLREGLPVVDNPIVDALLDGADFVHYPDLAEIAHPLVRAANDATGVRTGLFVPLRKDGALLGLISAVRRDMRPFSGKQVALLQNFAGQAVIAMENARLLNELRQRTDQVAELNRGLETRVAEQVEELGRVGRLKRFLAPQLAELIVSQGDEKILESHRREIVVVFCDLRGYTAFTETAEPEEVLDFLREYHGALGPLVSQYEGTLDHFAGDGIMVFFNDPVPCPDPAERAVNMAMAIREAAGALITKWRRRGRELGFGAGIAQGYATLGQIGFAERSGYTAIGTVCNLASRLCAAARDRQILVAQRVAVSVEETMVLEEVGALALKGLTQPVVAYNVPLVGSQAELPRY